MRRQYACRIVSLIVAVVVVVIVRVVLLSTAAAGVGFIALLLFGIALLTGSGALALPSAAFLAVT